MDVFAEKFADLKILRYAVPEFEALDLNKKLYIYYLSQAALCGRDILWDQNNRYNLSVRAVLETIWKTFNGSHETDSFKSFEIYLKRVWFSNGIHWLHNPTGLVFKCLQERVLMHLFLKFRR
jgi:dipeptidyl-peptidase-3